MPRKVVPIGPHVLALIEDARIDLCNAVLSVREGENEPEFNLQGDHPDHADDSVRWIMPRAASGDDKLDRKVDALFARWSDVADADGQLDFYGLQTLICREMVEAGEVLVRRRLRRTGDGLQVPLQVGRSRSVARRGRRSLRDRDTGRRHRDARAERDHDQRGLHRRLANLRLGRAAR